MTTKQRRKFHKFRSAKKSGDKTSSDKFENYLLKSTYVFLFQHSAHFMKYFTDDMCVYVCNAASRIGIISGGQGCSINTNYLYIS